MKSKKSTIQLIDTHAHLFLSSLPFATLWQKAQENHITQIINVAINLESSRQVLALHQKYPEIKPTIGIHPSEYQDLSKINEMETMLQNHKFCAVGEIGLDYFKNYAPQTTQITLFEKQLALADKYKLPVIIHNRHADTDILKIMANFPKLKYVFHCFSSNQQFIEKIFHKNIFFSFTGLITYSKKGKILQALKSLPLENIMLETDCPYLPPKKYQGLENQPAYLLETALKIAEIKNLSLAQVAAQTTQNALIFFACPPSK